MAFKLNCVAVCLALSMVFLNNVEGKECSDEDKKQCRPPKEYEEGPRCEQTAYNDCSLDCGYKKKGTRKFSILEEKCRKEGSACTMRGGHSSQVGAKSNDCSFRCRPKKGEKKLKLINQNCKKDGSACTMPGGDSSQVGKCNAECKCAAK